MLNPKSFIMTSLTLLRQILVDESGLMEKKETFETKYPFLLTGYAIIDNT